MRIFRFIKYVLKGLMLKRKPTSVAITTWWFLAKYAKREELRFFSAVITEISKTAQFIGLRPDDTKTLNKLLKGTGLDRFNFSAMDLDQSPTRSSLVLLMHYKDISKTDLYTRWCWASMRDDQHVNRKIKITLLRYKDQRDLLNKTINDVQQTVELGDNHEDCRSIC